jgi:hypothetical protein
VTDAAGRRWQEAGAWHIDVRGLAPPQPLVAVLRLVESVTDATPIVVHHDRDPVLLYPQLAERGWAALRIEGEPAEVRLYLCPPGMEPPSDLRPAADDAPSCLDEPGG